MTLPSIPTLRAIAEAATPGEWTVLPRCDNADPDRACGVTSDHVERGHRRGIFQTDAYDECSHLVSLADALHIATFSPSTVLALLQRVRELEAALGEACEIAEYRTPSSLEDRPQTYAHNQRLDALRALAELAEVVSHCGQCGWSGSDFHACPGLPGANEF